MGHQVIKQPDGRFAIFSTETDTIVVWDATAAEVVELFVEQAADDARRRATGLVEKVRDGRARDAYHQFAMSWDEALKKDREHGGEAHDHFPDSLDVSGPMPDRPDWWTPGYELAALEGIRDGIAARRRHPR